jgi:hypothetical protein
MTAIAWIMVGFVAEKFNDIGPEARELRDWLNKVIP